MLMQKEYQSILKWDLHKSYIQNVWHIYLIDKSISPTKYHNTNRSTRQTLWKKSSINFNFFKFNDSQYVCLCKTQTFQPSQFDQEAPDLSNNLLLSWFHKYSPDIESFHHNFVFLPNFRQWYKNTFFTLEVYHLCNHKACLPTFFC